jgi:protein-L-isoaspartate(D-aspartate) O-methyltransferase
MDSSKDSDFGLRVEEEHYRRARSKMVQSLRDSGIQDSRVLAAMNVVPRHVLVAEALRHKAYSNVALPIGSGQTISAPRIVALMSERLCLEGHEVVLEIGTGSGYQCAILSHLAEKIVSIERVPSLARTARKALDRFGVINALVFLGDGTVGRPKDGPYDAILVTAGGPKVPRSLILQLKLNGRLIGPFGPPDDQSLLEVCRTAPSEWTQKNLGSCRFVGLIGDEGWSS